MSHGSVAAEAAVAVSLGAAAVLYAGGTLAAWRRAGPGRGVGYGALACFSLGLAAAAIALLGPVDRWGAALFSAHMAQHTLLMNVAAPLLVLGAPLPAMLRALPARLRAALVAAAHADPWRGAWRWLTGATVATLLQLLALWLWHLPALIGAALVDEALHALMHATLLAAALLFWTVVFDARALSRWRGLACLVVTAKVTGIACLLLLLSDAVSYPAYGEGLRAGLLEAADDERAGWGLMMLTAGPAYFFAAAWLFTRALSAASPGAPRYPAHPAR